MTTHGEKSQRMRPFHQTFIDKVGIAERCECVANAGFRPNCNNKPMLKFENIAFSGSKDKKGAQSFFIRARPVSPNIIFYGASKQ